MLLSKKDKQINSLFHYETDEAILSRHIAYVLQQFTISHSTGIHTNSREASEIWNNTSIRLQMVETTATSLRHTSVPTRVPYT